MKVTGPGQATESHILRYIPPGGLFVQAKREGTSMFAHKWHKAQAKVVLSKMNYGAGTSAGRVMEFVVDVRTQDGRFFRGLLHEPLLWADFWPPTEGHIIGVEVEGDTQNIRFDKDDPRLSTRVHDQMQRSDVDVALSQPPGTVPDAAWNAGSKLAEPWGQDDAAPAHPEWNHTRNMHNAGDHEPPEHHLP